MSSETKDQKPNPHEVAVSIVEAAHKLRRHEGQFATAVVLLEKAVAEIYRGMRPMA